MYYIEMTVGMNLENSNEKLCTEKNDFCHVTKRITYGVWLDMIFIQRVVCFLSPRQCSEI